MSLSRSFPPFFASHRSNPYIILRFHCPSHPHPIRTNQCVRNNHETTMNKSKENRIFGQKSCIDSNGFCCVFWVDESTPSKLRMANDYDVPLCAYRMFIMRYCRRVVQPHPPIHSECGRTPYLLATTTKNGIESSLLLCAVLSQANCGCRLFIHIRRPNLFFLLLICQVI